MVSLYPNPPSQGFFIHPMKMGLQGLNLPPSDEEARMIANSTAHPTSNRVATGWPSEDPSKKVRKPYTITKTRESWTEQEHDKFLEALQLFDRDWKKIEAFVGSKTVIQIRSHAQKYFLKVQKSGTNEHVPPPRPKRKATHPYPQKAYKNASIMSQVPVPFQSSGALPETGYNVCPASLSVPRNSTGGATLPSWTNVAVPSAGALNVSKGEAGLSGPTMVHNSCSSSTPTMVHNSCSSSTYDSVTRIRTSSEINDGAGKVGWPVRGMPDFAQVYSFIGSVFDHNATDHLQKLKMMDPINLETVLLLMKNLSANLASPESEDHRKLLSSYDIDSEKVKCGSLYNDQHIARPENAIPSM